MSNIFSSIEGGVVGAGAGIGISAAVEPLVEPAKQEVWDKNPYAVLDPETLARLVAQALVRFGDAQKQAQRSGLDENKFAALVQTLLTTPGLADLDQLLNRELIDRQQFNHALAKHQIEPQYWDGLYDLLNDRLSPPVIALAIVRGIIADPGFLPVGPPTREGKVPAFPVSDIDGLKEAQAAGWNRERLFVQTAISGRPMGPVEAAQAVFRDILERVDFDRAVAEGDVRNEWADSIFETARQIASVADYVQAHLRGHITEAEMFAGAKRHGMSEADTRLIYLRSGRPAAPGQMATAAVRGIDGPAGRPMDREQFLLGIAESDIRPEWGPMLWDARFLYPSLFQLTRLVTSGTIDGDTGAAWAHKARYAPEVVTALRASWDRPTARTAKGLTDTDLADEYEARWLTRAQYVAGLKEIGYTQATAERKADAEDAKRARQARNQLIGRIHAQYVNHRISRTRAISALDEAGAPARVRDSLLPDWDMERSLTADALTAAQIKKAFRSAVFDRPTAVDRLEGKGYDPEDAGIYLDE